MLHRSLTVPLSYSSDRSEDSHPPPPETLRCRGRLLVAEILHVPGRDRGFEEPPEAIGVVALANWLGCLYFTVSNVDCVRSRLVRSYDDLNFAAFAPSFDAFVAVLVELLEICSQFRLFGEGVTVRELLRKPC